SKQYIQEQTGLSAEVAEQKLAHVVVSAEDAIANMVQQRTDGYQAGL
ncbi:MAG: hypothetical protein GTO39_03430, partial [Pseudomonas stutzeri]|nr:hypothetical protein [Stutzerimonas stutzeri]NIN79572.1 hypothetical protein [Stutzerimonas stutzeri]NIO14560.1 hypothetical protein [Xanthomonadales bacterium]NIQ21407.1 hypothetical protein [Stutzerimonas stutzeri]NIS55598.1 hypothetical protein [Stutzerimonas stutzeri]